jgi:RND family efflux transporter MFP subunit
MGRIAGVGGRLARPVRRPRRLIRLDIGLVLATSVLAFIGCGKGKAKVNENKLPEVRAAFPEIRFVADSEEFTGRLEATDTVEIRARVSGYLKDINFKDGDFVERGKVLFEIDDKTFKAEKERNEANLKQAEAHLARLGFDLARARVLARSRAMSPEEVDKISGDRAEAEASVGAAKAALAIAQVNWGYCKVYSPLTGRLSKRMVDKGNLVKADETPLTTIVSLDPIWAYFDVDERTVLRLRRLLHEGKIKRTSETGMLLDVALADSETYKDAFKGRINFSDNRLDTSTGTLRVRVEIANILNKTRGAPAHDYLLSPGMFVRVRVPIGERVESVLVPESALQSDQGEKFVYALADTGEVIYLNVQTKEYKEPRKPGKDKLGTYVDEAWVKENVRDNRMWVKKTEDGQPVYVYKKTDEVKKHDDVSQEWIDENVDVWVTRKIYSAEYRRVRLGPQDEDLRVVYPPEARGRQPAQKSGKVRKTGVKKEDLIVVSGMQRVKAGGKVILVEEPAPPKHR